MLTSDYLHQPHLTHRANCDCSVCWSARAQVKPEPFPSTPCTDCRRTRLFPVVITLAPIWGKWRSVHATYRVERGFTCAKHMPARRAPTYWYVVYDSGAPTPFVPIHEPFED